MSIASCCFPTMTALGSFLLLASFLMELFIMIGNLDNKPVIKDIYFAEAYNTQQKQSYQFGLWNYCQGDASGSISSCGGHSGAFDWARTPGISDLVPNQANSGLARSLFVAMFILFFVACGLSFVLWLCSLPVCCMKRRGAGYYMSTLVFINFLVALVAMILAIILIVSGVKAITSNGDAWHGYAGNSLWISIGAATALFLSFLCYGGSICGHSSAKKSKGAVDPNYKEYNGYDNTLPTTSQPLYMSSPIYGDNTGVNDHKTGLNSQRTGVNDQNTGNVQQNSMLQQPYYASATPTAAADQTSSPTDGINQQKYGSQNFDNNNSSAANVPAHGYQTPVLEPANTPSQQV